MAPKPKLGVRIVDGFSNKNIFKDLNRPLNLNKKGKKAVMNPQNQEIYRILKYTKNRNITTLNFTGI